MAGWLKNMLHGDAEVRKQFTEQIHRDFAFLFAEHGAKIVPNDKEYPPMFDNALVTVESCRLRFRFVQDRGEQRVDVAPLECPGAWEELDFVLMAIDPNGDKPAWATLSDLAEILRVRLAQVERAFSREQYDATRERLAEIHTRERNKWAAAFKSRA